MSSLYLGIDVGSVSVDAALLDADGRILWTSYRRHKGTPLVVAAETLEEGLERLDGGELVGLGATGSGGKLVAELAGGLFVNEIVSASRACARLHPEAESFRLLADAARESGDVEGARRAGGMTLFLEMLADLTRGDELAARLSLQRAVRAWPALVDDAQAIGALRLWAHAHADRLDVARRVLEPYRDLRAALEGG